MTPPNAHDELPERDPQAEQAEKEALLVQLSSYYNFLTLQLEGLLDTQLSQEANQKQGIPCFERARLQFTEDLPTLEATEENLRFVEKLINKIKGTIQLLSQTQNENSLSRAQENKEAIIQEWKDQACDRSVNNSIDEILSQACQTSPDDSPRNPWKQTESAFEKHKNLIIPSPPKLEEEAQRKTGEIFGVLTTFAEFLKTKPTLFIPIENPKTKITYVIQTTPEFWATFEPIIRNMLPETILNMDQEDINNEIANKYREDIHLIVEKIIEPLRNWQVLPEGMTLEQFEKYQKIRNDVRSSIEGMQKNPEVLVCVTLIFQDPITKGQHQIIINSKLGAYLDEHSRIDMATFAEDTQKYVQLLEELGAEQTASEKDPDKEPFDVDLNPLLNELPNLSILLQERLQNLEDGVKAKEIVNRSSHPNIERIQSENAETQKALFEQLLKENRTLDPCIPQHENIIEVLREAIIASLPTPFTITKNKQSHNQFVKFQNRVQNEFLRGLLHWVIESPEIVHIDFREKLKDNTLPEVIEYAKAWIAFRKWSQEEISKKHNYIPTNTPHQNN